MAEIKIKLREMVYLASKNNLLPESISITEVTGQKINFKINPGKNRPDINASISFNSFEKGKIVFTLKINPIYKLMMRFIKLPENDYLKVNTEFVTADINKIVAKRIVGIKISEISYQNNRFIIKTRDIS